jgi:PadR family transcriptional regulator, regulatory protein PadR
METQRELLRGSTPTLVLAVLRDGPLHGYGIAREIERRSGKSLQCREGTLYPVLRALEEEGLIAGEWQLTGERGKKVYSLTPEGAGALEQRTQTWTEFVDAVQRVLGGISDDGAADPERRRPYPGPLSHRPEPAG